MDENLIPQSNQTQKRGGPWWTAPLVENNNTIEINKLTTPFSLLEPSRTLFEKAASAFFLPGESKRFKVEYRIVVDC